MKRTILIFGFLATWSADATEMSVRARGNGNLNDVFFSQIASASPAEKDFLIRVNLSCFSTNLRSVANPISPTGVVRMNMGIGPNSIPDTKRGTGDFAIWFPGWMVLKRGAGVDRGDILNLTDTNDPNPAVVFGSQNSLLVRPKGVKLGLNRTKKTYTRAETLGLIHYINFEQDIQARGACWGARQSRIEIPLLPGWMNFLKPSASQAGGSPYGPSVDAVGSPVTARDTGFGQPQCDSPRPGWNLDASVNAGFINASQRNALYAQYKQFMGHDGPLSSEWRASWSSDFTTLVVDASFPGEFMFCGGYFSPLMLFLDEKRPEFTGRSKFQVHPLSDLVYWPEAGSPGYFLALDVNGNGRIDDWTEIFGADSGQANGFEKLREYDTNHDGVIDRKDPVFDRLLLWRDTTGTGVSRAQDLHSLRELGVTSISLRYESKVQYAVENRALLREKATFTFKKNGQLRKGEVIDVWLSNR